MITVKELIAMLQKLPPETQCKTYSREDFALVEIYIEEEKAKKVNVWL